MRSTDRNFVPNSKVNKLLNSVGKNEQQLIGLLSKEEQTAFQEFKNVQDELSGVNEYELFTLGFRLGALFMLEVMEGLDIPFIDE